MWSEFSEQVLASERSLPLRLSATKALSSLASLEPGPGLSPPHHLPLAAWPFPCTAPCTWPSPGVTTQEVRSASGLEPQELKEQRGSEAEAVHFPRKVSGALSAPAMSRTQDQVDGRPRPRLPSPALVLIYDTGVFTCWHHKSTISPRAQKYKCDLHWDGLSHLPGSEAPSCWTSETAAMPAAMPRVWPYAWRVGSYTHGAVRLICPQKQTSSGSTDLLSLGVTVWRPSCPRGAGELREDTTARPSLWATPQWIHHHGSHQNGGRDRKPRGMHSNSRGSEKGI